MPVILQKMAIQTHFTLSLLIISQHHNKCYLFWLTNYLIYRLLANSGLLFALNLTFRVVVWVRHQVSALNWSNAAFGDIAVFAELFCIIAELRTPNIPVTYHSCFLTCIYPSEYPHTFSTILCTALDCQTLLSLNIKEQAK